MIVAGFGFRADADTASLRDALARACRETAPIQAIAAPADKVARLTELALEHGVPIIPVAATALQAERTLTRSPASLAARRCGSVAEAAALAAAGPGARLLALRHISSDRTATCAIAQGVST
ncbi:MAG: precorrin methylase [Novosphingobium lindaniclasticum]|uniref:cobalamin biosynthesis protein n=1 Tax=Novosphingobium lindaniclasticum TaxID=1329895 RepID=UPI00240A3DF9|nr:cobalamin biosynthesis protein [Novosphingobium lindaniclasticum]MDF2639161.1 precorrin methylase [Novosphingobium lindaniclasticum]